ncbi:MAG: two-component system sensor kinase [Pseudonocardiaceae bacterium]|nr:two-component system sensor kinase [Pseudonocardiaceae bacterium]
MTSSSGVASEYDGTRPSPPVPGAALYLLVNLASGIFWSILLVTLTMVGIGTAVIWVGVPILMLAAVLCRGGAILERSWIRRALGVYIASPYRPLPSGFKAYWRTRLSDPATWRDLGYFLLLLPFGIIEFALMVALWSASLGLLFLPVYFRFLPTGSWRWPDWDRPWVIVDSTLEALPWAALGLLLLVVAIVVTKAAGAAHGRFARSLLGPGRATIRRLDAQSGSDGTPSRGQGDVDATLGNR